MKLTIAILSTVIFGLILITVIVKSVIFNQQCGGYLERAANANTPEIAIKELDIALEYLEENGLTDGYTSVIYKTPSDDLGFFYSNLKEARNELAGLDSSAGNLEKSNMLIKLRETILDHGSKGDHLALANGISRYPHNSLIAFTVWISFIIACVAWVYYIDEL